MPSFKKKWNKFSDWIRGIPEWQRPMLENAIGYRNKEDMDVHLSEVKYVNRDMFYLRLKPDSLERAIHVYARAGRPKLGFLVIGRKYIESTEFNPTIDDDMLRNLGKMNTMKEKSGSILHCKKWDFLVNDMFIAGGIANNQPFYLASNRNYDNIFHKLGFHETIFARELAGIFAAGYELQKLADNSEVLVPPIDQAIDLDIVTYYNARQPSSK